MEISSIFSIIITLVIVAIFMWLFEKGIQALSRLTKPTYHEWHNNQLSVYVYHASRSGGSYYRFNFIKDSRGKYTRISDKTEKKEHLKLAIVLFILYFLFTVCFSLSKGLTFNFTTCMIYIIIFIFIFIITVPILKLINKSLEVTAKQYIKKNNL